MTMHGLICAHRLSRFIILGIFFLLVMLPSGCGDDGRSIAPDGSTETVSTDDSASASLTIRWHKTPASRDADLFQTAALDCQSSGIENVVCNVYDTSGARLAGGGPWPCTDGGGRIERIPAGRDRIFVVLAEDSDGNIRFQGETPGIAITAGEITAGVVVDAFSFTPTLTTPDNDTQIDTQAVSLEWQAIDNAEEYLVQIADNTDFQDMIVDHTTPATVYAPSNLQPSTDYFWKISAVDAHTNIGEGSEVRRFSTTASGCSFTISPTGRSAATGGETYDVNVSAANSSCEWTASENSDWITITPASGTGSGTVRVSVDPNPGGFRSGAVTIAGETHTVSQSAAGCSYTIEPESQNAPASGTAYNVTVSATHSECDWTASENSNWISITPASGSGGGAVRVTVEPNSGASRSAQITIAGQTHTVSQEAGACSYTISPLSRSVPAGGLTYDVTVSATHSQCDWTASEDVGWISITPASGSGSGTVRVTVAPNDGAERPAQITIAGQTHNVLQEAADCSFNISPSGRNAPADGLTYSVTVTANHSQCNWAASEDVDWISVTPTSGSGGGTVRVSVDDNPGISRRADIDIAGQTHTVTQDAAECSFSINPTSQQMPAIGGDYTVTVTATHAECNWTASEDVDWISLTPSSGSGSDAVRVTVSSNAGDVREADITIANISHRVFQGQNAGPIISNVNYTLVTVNDERCDLELPVGSSFEVTFDYSDEEGNGPRNIGEANLTVSFDFPLGVDGRFTNYTWNSSLEGNGSSGSATTLQCYRFGQNSFVDVTMTIEDRDGALSNAPTITIDRPSGSN